MGMTMRAVLAAVLLLAAGCAGKVETIHTDAAFSPADLQEEIVVLGGFVASSRLASDPAQEMPSGLAAADYFAQSEAWSPLLYGQFLAGAPTVQVWPWDQLVGRVDSLTVAAAHATVARGGMLQQAQLAQLAAGLPEARYLAVARLDRNEVSLHNSTEQAARTSWERDGVDGEREALDRSVTTRRRIAVTLDLYDLREGRSVWTATANREAKELYNYAEPEQEEATGELADNPAVRVKGTPKQGPPLESLLDAACRKLVEQLFGEESGE